MSHYNTYIDLVLNGNGAGALSCATISGSAYWLSLFFRVFYSHSFEFLSLSFLFFLRAARPACTRLTFKSFLSLCSFFFPISCFGIRLCARALNVPMFTFSDCLFSFLFFDSEFEMLARFLSQKNSVKRNKSRELIYTGLHTHRRGLCAANI